MSVSQPTSDHFKLYSSRLTIKKILVETLLLQGCRQWDDSGELGRITTGSTLLYSFYLESKADHRPHAIGQDVGPSSEKGAQKEFWILYILNLNGSVQEK